ncbi:hypothetical protein [Caulobacter segnis]|uniref:hypothetical protein n=1 Tax=Caulobacter segnis TaxID=88688 RepID=UPI001CBBEED9|nr:hypothetical protein [Caulobacter segnis]UAL12093.1 hypothetical protein K8940_07395 [Caulobacter segnis]
MKLSGVLAAMAIMSIAPPLAFAQSPSIPPEIMGRFDILGRLAGDAPSCQVLGYGLRDQDGKAFDEAVARYGERVGVSAQDAAAAVAAAKADENQAMRAKMDAAQARLDDPSADRALRDAVEELATKCRRAVDDPIGSTLMTPPVGNIPTVVRRYVDSLLEPKGRAGWQTPFILGGGELARTVGACQARLTRAQVQSALAPLNQPFLFAPDVLELVKPYFAKRQAAGRDKPLGLSAAQCQKLIAKKTMDMQKAGY